MVIAVDFDGTIVENRLPNIGPERPFAVECLLNLQKEDKHQLILWTVREGFMLEEAVDWCKSNGIVFFAVNKSFPEEKEIRSRKIKADLFIDDCNLGGIPDWKLIDRMIRADKPLQNYEEVYFNAFKVKEKAFLKRNFLLRLGTLFAQNR